MPPLFTYTWATVHVPFHDLFELVEAGVREQHLCGNGTHAFLGKESQRGRGGFCSTAGRTHGAPCLSARVKLGTESSKPWQHFWPHGTSTQVSVNTAQDFLLHPELFWKNSKIHGLLFKIFLNFT